MKKECNCKGERKFKIKANGEFYCFKCRKEIKDIKLKKNTKLILIS